MSLENEIKKLTAAVETLTAAMNNGAAPAVAVESTPVAPVEPAAVSTPPIATSAPETPQVAAPVAPAPVAEAPAAPAPVATAAPFADSAALTKYVMEKYQALGAEKGGQIQGVLQNLGFSNINDVTPDKYAEFHAGVEAIV